MKGFMMVPVLVLGVQPAIAQLSPAAAPPAPPKPVSTCEALSNQWRSVEWTLAENDAVGVADNSAPRATLREMRASNELSKASMILTLMTANKCSLPKRAPSHVTYMIPALECSTERMKGNRDSPKCDYKTWKAIGE